MVLGRSRKESASRFHFVGAEKSSRVRDSANLLVLLHESRSSGHEKTLRSITVTHDFDNEGLVFVTTEDPRCDRGHTRARDAMAAMAPERELLKRFEVQKFLGKGSYGSV